MRRLCLCLLVLLCARPAAAAVTVVQTACNTGTSVSSITVTFGGATTAGNAVIGLSTTYSTNRDVTFADGNAGETWVEPTNGDVTFGSPIFARSHANAMIVSTGSTTVIATYSGSLGGDGYVCAIEIAGNDAADINDDGSKDGINAVATTFDTSTGGTSSGSLTTSNANAILVGTTIGGGGQTIACGSGYTQVRSATDSAMCYRIVSSTGSYTISNTTGSVENGGTHLSAFDGSGGGGGGAGTPNGALTLLGVGP